MRSLFTPVFLRSTTSKEEHKASAKGGSDADGLFASGSRFAALRDWLQHPPLWCTLFICGLILLARRIDDVRRPQFWAEDGVVFFQHAWTTGWPALLEPCAGYLCTWQRLVAALAVQGDPLWAPAIFMAGAGLLTLYTAARTQSSRFPLSPHIGYALAVVLVPDAFEVLLFLVNSQWLAAAALVLLLISHDPRKAWQWMHDVTAAVVLGFTGPFSILFAPLFVWRAWHRRTRASVVLAGLVTVCAVVQGWMLAKYPESAHTERIAYETLLAAPGTRIAGSLFAGSHATSDIPLLAANALGALALIGVSALGTRVGTGRIERTWLAFAFCMLLAASLYRCRFVLPLLQHPGLGARYFFAPQMFALWLVIAALGADSRWFARGAAATLLWMVAINFSRLREPALTDYHWADHARTLRHGEAINAPINPADWTVSLPARTPSRQP